VHLPAALTPVLVLQRIPAEAEELFTLCKNDYLKQLYMYIYIFIRQEGSKYTQHKNSKMTTEVIDKYTMTQEAQLLL